MIRVEPVPEHDSVQLIVFPNDTPENVLYVGAFDPSEACRLGQLLIDASYEVLRYRLRNVPVKVLDSVSGSCK